MALAASGDAVEAKADGAAQCQQIANSHARGKGRLKTRQDRHPCHRHQRSQPLAPIHAFAQKPGRKDRHKDGGRIGNRQTVGDGGVVERGNIAAKVQRGHQAKAKKARPIAWRRARLPCAPSAIPNTTSPAVSMRPALISKAAETQRRPAGQNRAGAKKKHRQRDQIQPTRLSALGCGAGCEFTDWY